MLGLGDNQITDIPLLSGLTNLKIFGLEEKHIPDITPLSGLSNLTEVNLQEKQITDISSLHELPNLTVLLIAGNPLSKTAKQNIEILKAKGISVSF